VYSLESDELRTGLHKVPMNQVSQDNDGTLHYRATFSPEISGRLAYGVRVYPANETLTSPFDIQAIRWA